MDDQEHRSAHVDVASVTTVEARPLGWWNARRQGDVRNESHLTELLGLVGTGPEWQFLVVKPLGYGSRPVPFAQACGGRRGRFAIELGFADRSWLLAPAGAADFPLIEVGTARWRFRAHPAELVPLGEASRLMLLWARAAGTDAAYELRSADNRGATRITDR